MASFDTPKADSVRYLEDLLRFIAHYHGTPVGKSAHIAFVKGMNKFLEQNPDWDGRLITFRQLARVCEWGVRNRKGRLRGPAGVCYLLDEALKCGVLPELERKTAAERTDEELYAALAVEADPEWRAYLMSTCGSLQQQALREWRQIRGSI
jgi:hypothetical protein